MSLPVWAYMACYRGKFAFTLPEIKFTKLRNGKTMIDNINTLFLRELCIVESWVFMGYV
jgi:hypothetical protein